MNSEWIGRVARYAISLGRRLRKLKDNTEYQISLVYQILEAQNKEIEELKGRLGFLESKDRLQVYLELNGWKKPAEIIKPIEVGKAYTINYDAIAERLKQADWETPKELIKPIAAQGPQVSAAIPYDNPHTYPTREEFEATPYDLPRIHKLSRMLVQYLFGRDLRGMPLDLAVDIMNLSAPGSIIECDDPKNVTREEVLKAAHMRTATGATPDPPSQKDRTAWGTLIGE